MSRTRLVAICASAAVGMLTLATSGMAHTPADRLPGTEAVTATNLVPRSLSNKPVEVVVQLSGKSVAEVQAERGHRLSPSEKQQIKQQLKAKQDALLPAISSSGGQVLNQFQSAIDGIKVRTSPKNLAKLASLPEVIAVRPVQTYRLANEHSVPFIGAPTAWSAGPFTGAGEKIGIIDTGIDYTHANFGGPGTAAAYINAHASETLPANPLYFGPSAPKVKGGTDLVGDNYDADGTGDQPNPHPDPNPLDCNGHGSHVAGTAAGFGVLANGSTFTGPWTSSTIGSNTWTIGPGVAPQADLYAIRVFGCSGTTSVVVDALDWAVDHDLDVVNMSLGSPFGVADSADAIASDNAAAAGVVVVASAGNETNNVYTVGTPSTSKRAISVAGVDSHDLFAGLTVALTNPSSTLTALNANGATVTNGTMFTTIKYLTDNPSTPEDESLGCSVAAFGSVTSSTLAVVHRGTCARVAKAIFGQQAGAGAVAMINNATGFPPFEGEIFSNPDDGTPFHVTIPFLGIQGPFGSADDLKLKNSASGGGSATLTNTTIANPTFKAVASFSSGGPRTKDSGVKPDVAAPGVSIFSTAVGTGNKGEFISGTSMAAPHVTGVAALTRQAHPLWDTNDIKADIVNSADDSSAHTSGFSVRTFGSGVVQPASSTMSQADAFAQGSGGETGISFGFAEVSGTGTFTETKTVRIVNHSGGSMTFTPSFVDQASSGATQTLSWSSCPSPVTVGAGGFVDCDVQLSVPKASLGDVQNFRYARGQLKLTPNSGQNGDIALLVPYIWVPRGLSAMTAKAANNGNVKSNHTIKITEKNSGSAARAGLFDWYAWGLSDPNDSLNKHDSDGAQSGEDVRAVGVQSYTDCGGPCTATDPLIVFGVNTWRRFSSPSENEIDVGVDVDPQNGNGDDYIVVGVDHGAVTAGDFDGIFFTFVFSTRSPGVTSSNFLWWLPVGNITDGSTFNLNAFADQLCRTGEPCLQNGKPFQYDVTAFDLLDNSSDEVDNNNDGVLDTAFYNPFDPALTDVGTGGQVAVGTNAKLTLHVNSEYVKTPFIGLMSVHYDNEAGPGEASLVPLNVPPFPH